MEKEEKPTAFRFKNKKINWLIKIYSRALKVPVYNYVENLIIEDLQKEETYDRIRKSLYKFPQSIEKVIKEIKELKKPKRKYYVPERPDV